MDEFKHVDNDRLARMVPDIATELVEREAEKHLEFFESLNPDPDDFKSSYDPECVRKIGNFASVDSRYLFEYAYPDREQLTWEKIEHLSPKLYAMLREIQRQDEEDMREHGRKFKHFVFSNIKSGPNGAKIVATALMDIFGMRLGYTAKNLTSELDSESDDKKKWGKMELIDTANMLGTDNVYLLSSVGVYQQPISVSMRKEILKRFNSRPDNSYGDIARIIVMDAGFKEGIDLFDIKYVHIFEPQTTMADQKQVIGRGTRTCGQKGLDFHPTKGWSLHVNIYDAVFPEETRTVFLDSRTVHELFLKTMGIDLRLLNLAADMERVYIKGAIDSELNRNIHEFVVSGGSPENRVADQCHMNCISSLLGELPYNYEEAQKIVNAEFADLKWDKPKMENLCGGGGSPSTQTGCGTEALTGGAPTVINYNSTQKFISQYFTPSLNRKGILLSHSVGTGKTCSAIAAATSSFEKEGYTILWVTRTTLKNDIWKNMFDQICNATIAEAFNSGAIPASKLEGKERMKLLSKAWSIRPMSYKQFSNLVSGKNAFHAALVKRNGAEDPLRKTLLIIDEAHKLYGESDLSTIEQPDMKVLYESLMRSYEVSGSNSARLLLMTATPITTSPMELVKLMNLCLERQYKIADDFPIFASRYLDESGRFTPQGESYFLDQIAGHISYLNRERDARMFSQPVIKHIEMPVLANDQPLYKSFDEPVVRAIDKVKVGNMRDAVKNHTDKINSLKEVGNVYIGMVRDQVLDQEDPKTKKIFNKASKITMRNIKHHVNSEVENTRNRTKKTREDITEFLKTLKAKYAEIKHRVKVHRGESNESNSSDSSNESRSSSPVEKIMYKARKRPSETPDPSSDHSTDENSSSSSSSSSSDNSSSMEGGFEKRPIIPLADDYQKYQQSIFNKLKKTCKMPAKRLAFDNYVGIQRMKDETKSLENLIKENTADRAKYRKNIRLRIKAETKRVEKITDPVEKRVQLKLLKKEKNNAMIDALQYGVKIKEQNDEHNRRIKTFGKITKKVKSKLERLYKKSLTKKRAAEKKAEKEAQKIAKKNGELVYELKKFENEFEDVRKELKTNLDGEVKEFVENANAEVREMRAKEEEKEAAKAAKLQVKADAKAQKEAAKAQKEAAKAEAKAQVNPRCPKGTKRHKPIGPDCYTQEQIDQWKNARK